MGKGAIMGGPWEDYQGTKTKEPGPWDDYASAAPSPAPAPIEEKPHSLGESIARFFSAGAPSYVPAGSAAAGDPEHMTGNVGEVALKPVADIGLGILDTPFHPIQTGKGFGLGVASSMGALAPSYVQPGNAGYVSPADIQAHQERFAGMADTPQEKRAMALGQMAATWGAPLDAPIAGEAGALIKAGRE
jgi:hypothetical protein